MERIRCLDEAKMPNIYTRRIVSDGVEFSSNDEGGRQVGEGWTGEAAVARVVIVLILI